jgi:hypothetical protein
VCIDVHSKKNNTEVKLVYCHLDLKYSDLASKKLVEFEYICLTHHQKLLLSIKNLVLSFPINC